jgi:hypothetical protein
VGPDVPFVRLVRLAQGLTALAIALPMLLVHWVAVGPGIFAQGIAAIVWGLALAAWGRQAGLPAVPWKAAWPLLAALAAVAAGVIWGWLRPGTAAPGTMVASLGLLAAAALTAATAARLAAGAATSEAAALTSGAAVAAWCGGVVVVATVSAAIALVQWLAPEFTDGVWLARPRAAGRATANLDQPNHLATLLVWGWLAALWLRARCARPLWRHGWDALGLVLVAVVAATASRSAALAVALLAVWGLADARWPPALRARLLAGAAALAAAWFARATLASPSLAQGWSETLARPSARGGIYADAWQLIVGHAAAGVGWMEFQLAWTLTPSPTRGARYFDHAHNVVLQLLAELGLALGGVALVLLALALLRAWRAARQDALAAPQRLLVLATLLVVSCHALFEAPWWYAYFLLPSAWLWGWLLGAGAQRLPAKATRSGARPLLIVGLAASCAAFIVWADFLRVLPAMLPDSHAQPLAERLQAARASRLFSHYADFKEALARGGAAPLVVFRHARHAALDVELLMPWAEALERAGEADAARHLTARVREFADARATRWLAACEAVHAQPVRCGTAARALRWQEFR